MFEAHIAYQNLTKAMIEKTYPVNLADVLFLQIVHQALHQSQLIVIELIAIMTSGVRAQNMQVMIVHLVPQE